MADHYAVLGVPPDATRAEIQAAYRDLARRHHPDFGGSEATMASLNEAWGVLGRPEARLRYDAERRRPRLVTGEISTPPPARSSGPISAAAARRAPEVHRKTLGFGRYADWTIEELAAHDPDYLEWLARAPAGLRFRQEIYTQLARRPTPASARTATAVRQPHGRSRFRRRLW